jgi:hypothetical protein
LIVRKLCEGYQGLSPLDIQEMTLDQVYCLVMDIEERKPKKKMGAVEAVQAGIVDPSKVPMATSGKSLCQRIKEQKERERAAAQAKAVEVKPSRKQRRRERLAKRKADGGA